MVRGMVQDRRGRGSERVNGLCHETQECLLVVSRCLASPGLLPYELDGCDQRLASNIGKDWVRKYEHKGHAIAQR